MPIEISVRPWNSAPRGTAEQWLTPPTALPDRTDANIAQDLETHYFAAPADARVPIALSVDGVAVDRLVGADRPQGERGAALLSALINTFRTALRGRGVSPEIAHVQARDLANLLACQRFVEAYKTLVTPDPALALHHLAIAVVTGDDDISFHTTASYTDIEAPIGITRLEQVVDLGVKFYSTRGFFSGTGRLEAEVTMAAVQLASPDAAVQPAPRDARRNALIATTKQRLGVPAQAAPISCWERLKQLLCRLLGERGIRFLVGTVNEISAVRLDRRPDGIDANGYENPAAWGVRAEYAFGRQRYPVASYLAHGGLSIVRRNGTPVEAETQQQATEQCARRKAANLAHVLREDRYLDIGLPVWTLTPMHAQRNSPRSTALSPDTYRVGIAQIQPLTEDGAQHEAMLREAVYTTLNGALFPAPGTQALDIEIDGVNPVTLHLRQACDALSAVERMALVPLDLAERLRGWMTAYDFPNFRPAAADNRPEPGRVEPNNLPEQAQVGPNALPEQAQEEPNALPGQAQIEPDALPGQAQVEPDALPEQAQVEPDALPEQAPVERDIAALKRALLDHLFAGITQALPIDAALQRQVLATLARAEGAMHRVCQINGLPTFENDLEQRRLRIVTRQTSRHLRAGTVNIAFNSWQHALSPGRVHGEEGGARQSGRVIFGDHPELIFPARLLSTAMLYAKAAYRVTNEATELTSVQYEATLQLRRALPHAHQPG